jgi:pimeloyl-ACP methyl ester carboxylesterase
MSTCLWFHGSNSGPAEAGLLAAAARRHGVELVPVARGDATDLRGQAATALAAAPAGRVAVAGWSAGAAIALTCAALAPDRVTGAVLVNPAAPGPLDAQQRAIAWACRRAPWLIRRTLAPLMVRTIDVTPAQLDDPRARARRLRFFPAVDRAVFVDVLADPDERAVFAQLAAQAVAAGPAAFAADLQMLWGRDWGFDPAAVAVPVHLVVGAADPSRAFTLPGATVHRMPGGHHGWLADRDRVAAVLATATQLSRCSSAPPRCR